jgi:hypothetical protein
LAWRQQQAHKKLCLYEEHRACYLRFVSRPLPSHTHEEICSYSYKELVSVVLYHTPSEWEDMSEEKLLVHVLSL